MNDFSTQLAYHRIRVGFTPFQAAEFLGISIDEYTAWESRATAPSDTSRRFVIGSLASIPTPANSLPCPVRLRLFSTSVSIWDDNAKTRGIIIYHVLAETSLDACSAAAKRTKEEFPAIRPFHVVASPVPDGLLQEAARLTAPVYSTPSENP